MLSGLFICVVSVCGCIDVFVCFVCELLCAVVWFGVCVLLCLCACLCLILCVVCEIGCAMLYVCSCVLCVRSCVMLYVMCCVFVRVLFNVCGLCLIV